MSDVRRMSEPTLAFQFSSDSSEWELWSSSDKSVTPPPSYSESTKSAVAEAATKDDSWMSEVVLFIKDLMKLPSWAGCVFLATLKTVYDGVAWIGNVILLKMRLRDEGIDAELK